MSLLLLLYVTTHMSMLLPLCYRRSHSLSDYHFRNTFHIFLVVASAPKVTSITIYLSFLVCFNPFTMCLWCTQAFWYIALYLNWDTAMVHLYDCFVELIYLVDLPSEWSVITT